MQRSRAREAPPALAATAIGREGRPPLRTSTDRLYGDRLYARRLYARRRRAPSGDGADGCEPTYRSRRIGADVLCRETDRASAVRPGPCRPAAILIGADV